MNILIFLLHIFLIIAFVLGALRLGKEALIAFMALCAIIANLFVLKQISLFGLTVTATDVFIIGSILSLNLLQEFFGQTSAKKASWITFFLMAFFALISQVHLAYNPISIDPTQAAYRTLLSPAPRLLIASLTTFFLVQQWDIRFYALLKIHVPSLFLRNALALTVSQALDTTLFSFLGLFGIAHHLSHIILFSFLVKLAIIGAIAPFITLSKRIAHASH